MKKFLLAASGALFFTATTASADVPPPPTADPITKCKGCHGPDLAGKAKSPSIAGEDKEKIKASMTTKIPKQMIAVSKTLTPEQIDALSAQISAMPKPAPK